MAYQTDIVIVGAGIIGLAVGRELARQGFETVILESEASAGIHTSSRNSEVVHAGIYYATNSLKAHLCVEGRRKLYAYAQEHGVDYRKFGKVITASRDEDLGRLKSIYDQGLVNGVEGLEWLDQAQVLWKQPGLLTAGGIWSPETGVIDSHRLMIALIGDFEDAGGNIAYGTPFEHCETTNGQHIISTADADNTKLQARCLINCAGPWSTHVARAVEGMNEAQVPKARYAKGCYFSYTGQTNFETLVYPLPFVGGLGIHVTLDLAGAAKFGPDIEWHDDMPAYDVNERSRDKFVQAIREYWPSVDPEKLVPSYAGVRPKIEWNGQLGEDFEISGPETHGMRGIYHLFGFDSPGLTSCLAIAEHVSNLVKDDIGA